MGETFDCRSLRCRSEAARTRPAQPSGRGIPWSCRSSRPRSSWCSPWSSRTRRCSPPSSSRRGSNRGRCSPGSGSRSPSSPLIAVLAGSLLTLLPDAVVSAVVAVLFLVGAAILWRSLRSGAEEEEDIADAPPHPSFLKTASISFGCCSPPSGGPLAAGHRRPGRPLRRPGLGVHRVVGGAAGRLGGSRSSSARSSVRQAADPADPPDRGDPVLRLRDHRRRSRRSGCSPPDIRA